MSVVVQPVSGRSRQWYLMISAPGILRIVRGQNTDWGSKLETIFSEPLSCHPSPVAARYAVVRTNLSMEPQTKDSKLIEEITCGVCIDVYKDPVLLQW